MPLKAVLVVFSAALALAPVAAAQPVGPGWGGRGWGPGPGMMGGAMENRPVTPDWGGKVLSYTEAKAYIEYGTTHGIADAKTNTVTFSGSDVVINLVAVQPGFDDQTFELHGLTNPTIIVPHDATVQLNLLNMDYGNNMEHTVEIVNVPPPYPYMSMMYLGRPVVPPLPVLPWRSSDNVENADYAAFGESFIASVPGHYWYLCLSPEHAETGMYGKFIVR